VVKNQRPKDRSLQERQARNWRGKAIESLKAYAKRAGKSQEDLKKSPPLEDEDYNRLWLDYRASLAYAKYAKHTVNPLPVDEWRNATLGDDSLREQILSGHYMTEESSREEVP
jgi:hypothetical protein